LRLRSSLLSEPRWRPGQRPPSPIMDLAADMPQRLPVTPAVLISALVSVAQA
jgi:hypothetical protein